MVSSNRQRINESGGAHSLIRCSFVDAGELKSNCESTLMKMNPVCGVMRAQRSKWAVPAFERYLRRRFPDRSTPVHSLPMPTGSA